MNYHRTTCYPRRHYCCLESCARQPHGWRSGLLAPCGCALCSGCLFFVGQYISLREPPGCGCLPALLLNRERFLWFRGGRDHSVLASRIHVGSRSNMKQSFTGSWLSEPSSSTRGCQVDKGSRNYSCWHCTNCQERLIRRSIKYSRYSG